MAKNLRTSCACCRLTGLVEELYRRIHPLLKLDTHPHFVQYIKLCEQATSLGAEWVRAPRLVIAGEERKRVVKIIRDGIKNRPNLAKRSRAGAQVSNLRVSENREDYEINQTKLAGWTPALRLCRAFKSLTPTTATSRCVMWSILGKTH